jgi:hypothetical protein
MTSHEKRESGKGEEKDIEGVFQEEQNPDEWPFSSCELEHVGALLLEPGKGLLFGQSPGIRSETLENRLRVEEGPFPEIRECGTLDM